MDVYSKEITSFIEEQYSDFGQPIHGCLPDETNLNNCESKIDKLRGSEDIDFELGCQDDKLSSEEIKTKNNSTGSSKELNSENNDEFTIQIKTENFESDQEYGCQDVEENLRFIEKVQQMPSNNSEFEVQRAVLKMKFHICKECGKVCKSPWKLMTHLKKHDPEELFVCPECGMSYNDRKEMKKHFRVHTAGTIVRPYSCTICPSTFYTPSKLQTHMWMHNGNRPYTCGLCNKSFTWSGGLRDHLKIHTGERPHSCKFCGKTFPDTSKLKNHQRIHTGERPHICPICGKGFIESGKLKRHLRTHTGEKPYHCDLCGKGFNVISNLHKHMTIHSGEKPYVCNICGRGFSQNVNLKTHSRIHTGEKDPYKCEKCGARFGRLQDVKTHLCEGSKPEIEKDSMPKSNHIKVKRKTKSKKNLQRGSKSARGDNSDGTEISMLKGDNFDIEFLEERENSVELNKNLTEDIERAYLLSETPELLPQETQMKIRDEVNTFNADIDKTINYDISNQMNETNDEVQDSSTFVLGQISDDKPPGNSNSDSEMNNSYFGSGDFDNLIDDQSLENSFTAEELYKPFEEEFHCKHCSKIFPTRIKLRKHEKIHTGVSTYICPHCGKAFIENSKLRQHLRSHTGEKPFSCEICNKSFSVSGNLQKHMILHTGLKPFVCSLCGRGFTQNTNLKIHMRIHTGEKDPYKCDVCNVRFKHIEDSRNHVCSGPSDDTQNKVNISQKCKEPKKKSKGVKKQTITNCSSKFENREKKILVQGKKITSLLHLNKL